MLTSVHFNTIQHQKQNPQQSHAYNYHQHHRRSSRHSTSIGSSQNLQAHLSSRLNSYSGINNSNNNNNNNSVVQSNQTSTSVPLLSSLDQTAAYFLDRTDLDSYSSHVLKQTVENIKLKTQSKGLKVNLSLPEDGLVIENIADPSQSWLFKKSELLYFWRDPNQLNVVVVVTINRSRLHSNAMYSASVFRLRGTNTAQAFILQAQQFFTNLPTVTGTNGTVMKLERNKSSEKVIGTDDHNVAAKLPSTHKTVKKKKSASIIREQSSTLTKSTNHRNKSPTTTTTTTTNIRRVTRAEFDPGKGAVNPLTKAYNNRTYSETTSSDSQTCNSAEEILLYIDQLDTHDDDKMTILSNSLSSEQIVELMRELKELRSEISALKLEHNIQPNVRSVSTSPLVIDDESTKAMVESSTVTSPTLMHNILAHEIDVGTQTDSGILNSRSRSSSNRNKKTTIGSSTITTSSRNFVESRERNGRTLSSSSTNTVSDDQEGSSIRTSSQMNDSSSDTNTSTRQEPHQLIVTPTPPRPALVKPYTNPYLSNNMVPHPMINNNYQRAISNISSNEEGVFLSSSLTTDSKEIPQFLSANVSSLNVDNTIRPLQTTVAVGNRNFQLPTDKSKDLAKEHIYENVPILIKQNPNHYGYYNIPIINVDDQNQRQTQEQRQNLSDDFDYYTIVNNNNDFENQQQYQLPSQPTSNPLSTTDHDSSDALSQTANVQQPKRQIISAGRHRNQPIYFANHLTNPLFNVDKQLLINTVANQFGVDLNSPQLQQLVSNQHLFAARKRTFANMVWQLTPDEENALCSPPVATQSNIIDANKLDPNFSANRSILKATNRLQSPSKRRSISWDTTLG